MTWDRLKDSLAKKRSVEEIILHLMQLPCRNFRPTCQ